MYISVKINHPETSKHVDWQGYKVEIKFYLPFAKTLMPQQEQAAETGAQARKAQFTNLRAIQTRLGYCDAAGLCSIDIGERTSGPYVVTAIGPSGARLGSRSFAENQLHGTLSVEVLPEASISLPPVDNIPVQRKLKGKVVDIKGEVAVRNAQVIFYDRSGETDSVIAIVRTDTTGSFSALIDNKKYGRVTAVVSENVKQELPVSLDKDGFFPDFIYLILENLVAYGAEEDDCACHDTTPFLPDSEELTSDQYAQDIGGSCVNFTKPNRVLEEFDFYQVVRTTEPVIQSMNLEPGDEMVSLSLLPPEIFELLKNEALMQAYNSGNAFIDLSKRRYEGNGLIDVTKKRYDEGGILDPTRKGYDLNTSSEIAAFKIPAELPADILRELLAHPETLTLERLQAAHKEALLRQAKKLVDLNNFNYGGRSHLSTDVAIDWDETPTIYQVVNIAHGHLLHLKQRFKSAGYSLGDLVYSLPLAPGQKKQIAVFDWDRYESATRSESLDAREALSAYLDHQRDISDIVRGTVAEASFGGSTAQTSGESWGVGAGAAIPAGPALIGVAGGYSNSSGSASSQAWQTSSRGTALDSLQQLRDKTMQSASSVRSQRSTVVQTVNQGESFRVQTEVVANHNHCHALTVQYFEVLRHFVIEQDLVDVQECLFIPLRFSRFTEAKALRWRDALRTYLRVPRRRGQLHPLFRAFDAVERRLNNYVGSSLPLGAYADEPISDFYGELRVQFYFNMPSALPTQNTTTNEWTAGPWKPYEKLLGHSPFNLAAIHAQLNALAAEHRFNTFNNQIAPFIAEEYMRNLRVYAKLKTGGYIDLKLDIGLVSRYQRGVSMSVQLRSDAGTPKNIARSAIEALEIRLEAGAGLEPLPENSQVIIEGGQLQYRTTFSQGAVFSNNALKNDIGVTDTVWIYTPPTPAEMVNPRQEDTRIAAELIQHLNTHVEYYHHAIWREMDPGRRFMLLDGFIAPNSGGKSVASVVENRLIGIVGNCLVMPVARGFQLDPSFKPVTKEGETFDLLGHYQPLTPIPPFRISVPTRGVFAEAVAGACNACEKIDDSRFWKWEEHPIDEPTAIQTIGTPTPTVTTPNLTAKDLATPIINIQNVPNAPDPQGFAVMGQLLGNPNLFRDLSGLNANQLNALQAMLSTQQSAQNYAQMGMQMAQLAGQKEAMDMKKKGIDDKKNRQKDLKDERDKLKKQLADTEDPNEREKLEARIQELDGQIADFDKSINNDYNDLGKFAELDSLTPINTGFTGLQNLKPVNNFIQDAVKQGHLTPEQGQAYVNRLTDAAVASVESNAQNPLAQVAGISQDTNTPVKSVKYSPEDGLSAEFGESDSHSDIATSEPDTFVDVDDYVRFLKHAKNVPSFDPYAFTLNVGSALGTMPFNTPEAPDELTHVVIQIMAGDDLVEQLGKDLDEIGIFDPNGKSVGFLLLVDTGRYFRDKFNTVQAAGTFVVWHSPASGTKILESWGTQDIRQAQVIGAFLTRAFASFKSVSNVALGFWGHGGVAGEGVLTESDAALNQSLASHKTVFDTTELARQIAGYTDKLKILFVDACLNGMFEVLYEVKDFCEVFIGSQEFQDGDGYRYELIVEDTASQLPDDPEAWAGIFVNAFRENYFEMLRADETLKGSNQFTIGAFKTTDAVMADMITQFSQLSDLITPSAARIKELRTARANSLGYNIKMGVKELRTGSYDFIHFIDNLRKVTSDAQVQTACQALLDDFLSLRSDYFTRHNFSGLSLWVGGHYVSTYNQSVVLYGALKFDQLTQWSAMLANSYVP